MTNSTSKRFEERLRKLNDNSIGEQLELSSADIDELSVLFPNCEHLYPARVKDVFNDAPYGRTTHAKAIWVQRLLRIIDVERSIPDEERITHGRNPTETSELLPTFEVFSKDKERIFELCHKMRLIIIATTDFDEPHRLRLLNRIAAIEAETHKPKGMFDVVLGGVVDVGETLGKFGKNIKPLTDRMSEVAQIARKGTKEYDQIPVPEEVQKLPKPEDFDEE